MEILVLRLRPVQVAQVAVAMQGLLALRLVALEPQILAGVVAVDMISFQQHILVAMEALVL
jgi:multisubunit Na+/H+ antiporter MnhF subunit